MITWVLKAENLSVEDQESFREDCFMIWENGRRERAHILQLKNLFQEERKIKGEGK